MPASSDGTALSFAATDIALLRLVCVLPDAAALLDRYGSDPAFPDALRRRFERDPEATEGLLRSWGRLYAGAGGPPGIDDLEGPGRYLHLHAAFGVLDGLLRREPEPGRLELTLHRPSAGRTHVQVHADEPALVLTPGSIISLILTRAAAAPAVWALVAVAKPLLGKVVDSALGARETVLDELRRRQVDAQHSPLLQDLQTIEPNPARGRALVFVHGLFSTDLGTFDPLVTRLRTERALDDVEMIGYPHNPLEPIDDTARGLADLLVARLAPHYRAMAFVAHHRGGLVVRAAALDWHARLASAAIGKPWARWLGCVSFGTPHTGIPGADHAPRTLGAVARLAAPDAFGNEPRGFMGISDLLRLRAAMGDADLGLADLLPVPQQLAHAGPRRWLLDLEQAEAAASRADPSRRLRIHAIGGDAPSAPMWELLRPAGNLPDDWLVPTASSAPSEAAAVDSTLHSEADHCRYFLERRGVNDAAARLVAWFEKEHQAFLDAIGKAAHAGLTAPTSVFSHSKTAFKRRR
jgi:hypothetical protein